ncbi:hypothetical protein MUK42_13351 [Musa troglodytarum]|uniref:Uncharacterized protein n=1 Tax=Musa troglodytarum TaxID=320322 RepID=A0A9E7KJ90_9LILI|nr:hypothetical protein MUK42_13351 [Musa troglodytarum]
MMSQRISFDSEVREARVWMRDPELFVWLLRSFFLPSCFCVLLHRGNWRTGRRKFRKLILVIILQPNGVRRFCDSAWQE